MYFQILEISLQHLFVKIDSVGKKTLILLAMYHTCIFVCVCMRVRELRVPDVFTFFYNLLYTYLLFLASRPFINEISQTSSGAQGREGWGPRQLTLLDVIFFFLISTEACINSYAGVLRGRSPDSMSGTGMSSILSLDFFFALILRTRDV